MVPAFLLSLLKEQWTAMPERFRSKHAHPWLVWEPGAWTAPVATTDTVSIGAASLEGLGQGDALSFGLIIAKGRTPELHIGRNPENDIVVNDATVSRQHAILKSQSPAEWTLEPMAGVKAATLVGSTEVRAGQPVQLRSGDQVRLGEVTLTYYQFDDFAERLRQHQVPRR